MNPHREIESPGQLLPLLVVLLSFFVFLPNDSKSSGCRKHWNTTQTLEGILASMKGLYNVEI